jgi:arsenate reductase
LYHLPGHYQGNRNRKERVQHAEYKRRKNNPGPVGRNEKIVSSYESLFSRRAMKYKELGLKDKQLVEEDYRDLILGEYTFLKRPVVIIDKQIFVGSEKKNIAALKKVVR